MTEPLKSSALPSGRAFRCWILSCLSSAMSGSESKAAVALSTRDVSFAPPNRKCAALCDTSAICQEPPWPFRLLPKVM
jgi:hypothetical protein